MGAQPQAPLSPVPEQRSEPHAVTADPQCHGILQSRPQATAEVDKTPHAVPNQPSRIRIGILIACTRDVYMRTMLKPKRQSIIATGPKAHPGRRGAPLRGRQSLIQWPHSGAGWTSRKTCRRPLCRVFCSSDSSPDCSSCPGPCSRRWADGECSRASDRLHCRGCSSTAGRPLRCSKMSWCCRATGR